MANCKDCKENRIKNKNSNQYEIDIVSTMALITNRRLFIIILVLIVALIGTNCFWIYREMQYSTEQITTIEAEQESETGSNYAVGGDLIGETESKDYQNNQTQTENGR